MTSSELFPGVEESLNQLEKRGVLLGLVTGNLEPIARLEMERIGLNRYFRLGGFGSDNSGNRTELVKLAIRRARENFGFDGADIFLFGDTPRDVKAGREAKVKTVGVATGIYTMEQLKMAGADFVLENLEDAGRILEIVLD